MSLQNRFEYDVHVFDTDCYGVVWHGAYTKWIEMGRVNLLRDAGLSLGALSAEHQVIFPVAAQQFRFLRPGKLSDCLEVYTQLRRDQLRLIFETKISRKSDQACIMTAETTIVMTTPEGTLLKRPPDWILEALGLL